MEKSFEVEVDCVGGGTPHVHRMLVTAGSVVYNVAPTRVRLQYVCPASGEALMASFDVPAGAGRPFAVARVS